MGFLLAIIFLVIGGLLLKWQKARGLDKISQYTSSQEVNNLPQNFNEAINDLKNDAADRASEGIQAIGKIQSILMSNEQVLQSGYGNNDLKDVVYALTNKRFISCAIGIASQNITSINYSKITNVDINEKMNLTYVIIHTSEKSTEILIRNKQRAAELFNAVHEHI